jgi:hypothetical protein
MAKKANPYVSVGGTQITCVQDASFTANAQEISYDCGGTTQYEAGANDYALTFTAAVDVDSALLDATAEGTAAIWVFVPGGNTATYEGFTSDAAGTVLQQTVSAAANGYVTLSCNVRFNSVTRAPVA